MHDIEPSGRAALRRSGLRSALLLRTEPDGLATTAVVYEKRSKRRVSKRWRGLDKAIRRLSDSRRTAADSFLQRHERSNRKKKNGGLRDLVKNTLKAQRKGRKKLKLRFL